MQISDTRSFSEKVKQNVLTPSRVVTKIFVGAASFAVIWQFIRIVLKPEAGDFNNHWEFGRRLLAGEYLYAGGLGPNYAPFNALIHAPFGAMPLGVAHAVAYPLTIIGALIVFYVLRQMTFKSLPLDQKTVSWVVVISLLLSSRFIIRELLEAGPNMTILALAWLSYYLWVRGKEVLGGCCLGFAIAWKSIPALYLFYFLWKRQWKISAVTVLAAVIFFLSPVLVQGPEVFQNHVQTWTNTAVTGVAQTDALSGVLDSSKLQNISLRSALLRFFVHLPADHPARVDHPLYFDFFNFSPDSAVLVINLIMLTIAAFVAWSFRHPVKDRNDLSLLWEFAAISVAILLYSPLTWGHHCVALIPAFYLIARYAASSGRLNNWVWYTFGFYVFFILVLNRSVIGKELTWLLDSYRLQTWLILAFLAAVLVCRSRSESS